MTRSTCPIKRIIKRNGTIVPYARKRIANAILKASAAAAKTDRQLADSIAHQVEEALVSTYGQNDALPSVEDIQDVVENVLIETLHTDIAKKYIIYRHRRAMARAARAYEFEVTDNVPYKKIYEVLRWNTDHNCDSVEGLNSIIRRGHYPDLVHAADARYSQDIGLAAESLLERMDENGTRIVIVAGPSSSGKTTTTTKLSHHLQSRKMSLKAINIDHYFFDLSKHPRDEFGDYDYETPQALDLELINTHLIQLLDGKTVRTPHYDFKTGLRQLDVHELRLAKNEILLIDSLHGLYDGMTHGVPEERKFRLYVETLGQFRGQDGTFMRWSDNRLLRRMLRDRDHRNLKPMQTLTHWHYVRRSELKNIIPFIKHTDCVINTALPYELPVLRSRLFRQLSRATRAYQDDPKRLDAHIRANRVYDLLRPIRNVADDSPIPADSLLREFIGGSCYKY